MFGYLLKPRNSDEAICRTVTRSFLAVGVVVVVVAILAIVALYFFGAISQ
jgi:hypothetical protein